MIKGNKTLNNLIQQIIKFGIVGFACFIIDYGILVALTELFAVNYLVSSTISFCVSVIVNYILNVKYVFEVSKERSKLEEIAVFILFSLIGLGINLLLMWFGVEICSINYMITKFGAIAVVMIYNFITKKLYLEAK